MHQGLDIAKHGEAAYPLSAYGHGWEEEVENSENELDEVFPNGEINGEIHADTDRKGIAVWQYFRMYLCQDVVII